jgi:hypothetical protein
MVDGAEETLEQVAIPAIEKRILSFRGRQVMLDEDLADLYGVETRVLIQQVKRNTKRFPEDFMFRLTDVEAKALRSQNVISKEGRGGAATRRMSSPSREWRCSLASFAVTARLPVNIEIMRAFVELRRAAFSYEAIEERLEKLERETSVKLGQHDEQLNQIFEALRQLISPPPDRPKRPVGFRLPDDED